MIGRPKTTEMAARPAWVVVPIPLPHVSICSLTSSKKSSRSSAMLLAQRRWRVRAPVVRSKATDQDALRQVPHIISTSFKVSRASVMSLVMAAASTGLSAG